MFKIKDLYIYTAVLFCFSFTAYGKGNGEGIISDTGIEVSGSLDSYSQYVWRGFLLDDDAVIQPGIGLSFKGLSFSLWSSFDAADDDSLASDEVDYIIDYTHNIGIFSLSIGNTFYFFPAYDSKSMEMYLSLGMDVISNPSITLYLDYGNETEGGADGVYVSLDLSHNQPVHRDITLDVCAHAGYNHELFITGNGYDIALATGLTLTLFDKLALKPAIYYTVPFAELSDELNGNQKSNIYAGASINWAFQ